MADPAVKTSQRFSRAARAERDRLVRRRSQLFEKREGLQATIDQLDEELEAVDDQILVLENLADSGPAALEPSQSPGASEDPELLSGGLIRALAVPLLMRERGTSPIHYKDWYQLLAEKGYSVAGKRPDAVFLNQVSRSPLVRPTTRSGYYSLDPTAVDHLRKKLSQQQTELVERMTRVPGEPSAFQAHREDNRALKTQIARTERELEEAMSALEAARPADSRDAEAA